MLAGPYDTGPAAPIRLDAVRWCSTLVLLTAALLQGCASRGAVPSPFPGAPGPPATAAAERHLDRYTLVQTALSLRGSPYRNGGSDPHGFDCSGFIQYVFGHQGIALPRTVAELFAGSARVRDDEVIAGDLVFFRIGGREVSHVGLLVGGDEFVHAPRENGEVRVERLTAGYWRERFAEVRRVR